MHPEDGSVAILVLNFNNLNFLDGCLTSLSRQTYKKFKIFLIDNASTDNSVSFVKKKFPEVAIIMNSEDYGFGKGFNEGIKRVCDNFEYIALVNADNKVDAKWLEELVTALENDRDAQVCTSLALSWDGQLVDNAGGLIVNFLMGSFAGILGGIAAKSILLKYRTQNFPVFFGIANAMLVRARTFNSVGLFDESYFMYFEDIDLSWRILLSGGRILCNPKAVTYHFGHGSDYSKDDSLKLLKQTETNLLATYFKNLSSLSFLLVFFPLVFMRIVFSLFYLFISPKITLAKLQGIISFFRKLLLGRYNKDKIFVSNIRILSDFQVLLLNPGNLFSVTPLIQASGKWFQVIKNVYTNRRRHLISAQE